MLKSKNNFILSGFKHNVFCSIQNECWMRFPNFIYETLCKTCIDCYVAFIQVYMKHRQLYSHVFECCNASYTGYTICIGCCSHSFFWKVFHAGVKLALMCSAFPLPSQLLLLMRIRWISWYDWNDSTRFSFSPSNVFSSFKVVQGPEGTHSLDEK